MKYTAPFWLPSGHLQTIYPALAIRKPAVRFRRERWDTPDGDFIDIDFVAGQPGQPFVVLFHGLEGSSDSHYARALMADVAARGWSGAVPHGATPAIRRMIGSQRMRLTPGRLGGAFGPCNPISGCRRGSGGTTASPG